MVMSDATGPTNTSDARPSTAEETQRVRFSSDTSRKTKKRKSSESIGPRDGTNSRREALSLTIDTSGATNGQGILASPTSMSSVTSPKRQQSTLSPRTTRNRGMSLRSSMFLRQMSTRTPTDHSVVELQDLGNSSRDLERQTSAHTKKGSRSMVREVLSTTRSPSPISSDSKPAAGSSALPNYQQWVQRRARRHLPVRTIRSALSRARNFLFEAKKLPPSKNGRQISYDAYRKKALIDERSNRPFVSNLIRSSKYTPWNFLPRQLFAQFSKIANAYFLTISILQMIPGLSTTGNYTTIIPLLFFVSMYVLCIYILVYCLR